MRNEVKCKIKKNKHINQEKINFQTFHSKMRRNLKKKSYIIHYITIFTRSTFYNIIYIY